MTVLLLNSCVSRKKLTYLKTNNKIERLVRDMEDDKYVNSNFAYKIKPYDILFVRVVTPDPQWSEMFNSASEDSHMTGESAALMGYPVNNEGYIEIPFVGDVKVVEMTLKDLKNKLESIFSSYVTDASIMVRLVNNYVSVLGEVGAPGRYSITKDRVNILEAIAMAGDLSEYGDRKKVQLIRPTSVRPVVIELSLSDRRILDSDYYFIEPNDIIYVPPLKGRTFQMNAFIYSMTLSVLNTGLVVYALFRNN